MAPKHLRPVELQLTVRPPRRMILVPVATGVPWQLSFAAALSRLCGTWGGVGDLVVPLDATTADRALFWDIAALQDADVYAVDWATTGDLQHVASGLFDERLTSARARFPDMELDAIVDYLADQPLSEGLIDSHLQTALLRQLCPMAYGDVISDGTPAMGHVEALDVEDLRDLPPDIIDTRTTLGPDATLLLAAEFGIYNSATRDSILETDRRFVLRKVESELSLASALYSSQQQQGVHPWTVAQSHLEFYRPGYLMRRAPVVVVGDDPWDFALFYALRRLHGVAWWAPSTVLSSVVLRERLLRRVGEFGQRLDLPVHVTSASDLDAAEAICSGSSRTPGRRGVELRSEMPTAVLPEVPGRLAESGQIDIPQAALLQSSTSSTIATPMPLAARHRVESETQWIVEATVVGWSPMRHATVARRVLSGTADWQMRATAIGLAWQSGPTMRIVGQPLSASVVRPTFTILSLLDQVSAVLEERGWRILRSDKGAYAQRAADPREDPSS